MKEINLCESSFMIATEFDYLPLVYYRISKPLKEGEKLPLIDLSQLFEADSGYKFECIVNASAYWCNNT